jgi:hypothetical protein
MTPITGDRTLMQTCARKVQARAGRETVFMQAQTHAGENIGTTDTHVLIVELETH